MTRYAPFILGAALACAACSSAGDMSTRGRGGRIPSAPSGLEVPPAGNVNVTRVRAYMKDGRLQALVQGELGDGCTRLERITQSRAGNSIDITVTSKREGEVCTMIFQYLNEWVPLEGALTTGQYVVRANKAEKRFELVRDATGALRIEPDPGPLPTAPYFPF